MKKMMFLFFVLLSFEMFASPLDDADIEFYTEKYQNAIDTLVDDEKRSAQQSFRSACQIRRYAAALALASEGEDVTMVNEAGEEVVYVPADVVSEYEEKYKSIAQKGGSRADFWNYAAISHFFAAKYYASRLKKSESSKKLQEADAALRRGALMSAHNKQLWYFASIIYGDSSFDSNFHNVSYAVSFMRRYLMISGQEADVLGLNRLSVLLRERDFSLNEKREALVEINKNLRTLSDPYKKYRYVEGYMPTTCWYNYASNHVFKNVSDETEADLIDVFLKRKINPTTKIGAYINERIQ